MSSLTHASRLLLDQIRSGDEDAWQQFIARYEGRLLAFVSARLANRSQAEDIVQETLIGFLTSLPNYDEATPIDSFLFAIAAHKLTDALRRAGRRPAVPLPGSHSHSGSGQASLPGPARGASTLLRSREDRQGEQIIIRDCLQNLIHQWLADGELERLQCAELLFVLGWPNKDVAHRLGISEKAVANHKFFIVSKLKQSAAAAGITEPSLPELA
ncbi:MAG: RNA polymerase sigma factor [Planctomycetota bacterium]|jgi:RNA polymerase sigma-70 factor (ECF subfamily)